MPRVKWEGKRKSVETTALRQKFYFGNQLHRTFAFILTVTILIVFASRRLSFDSFFVNFFVHVRYPFRWESNLPLIFSFSCQILFAILFFFGQKQHQTHPYTTHNITSTYTLIHCMPYHANLYDTLVLRFIWFMSFFHLFLFRIATSKKHNDREKERESKRQTTENILNFFPPSFPFICALFSPFSLLLGKVFVPTKMKRIYLQKKERWRNKKIQQEGGGQRMLLKKWSEWILQNGSGWFFILAFRTRFPCICSHNLSLWIKQRFSLFQKKVLIDVILLCVSGVR